MSASEINYEKLENALRCLREQNANFRANEAELPDRLREVVIESVAHRFAICYEMLWKHLRRHLENETGLTIPRSPRAVFQTAHRVGMLTDLDAWLGEGGYVQTRGNIQGDLDGQYMRAALAKAPAFIADTEAMYNAMIGAK